ncbi:MAG TPA: hypothetical protein EYG92_01100 [Lutibacter sp.]|nr:hypothetical protein [Lutibacter sp.]
MNYLRLTFILIISLFLFNNCADSKTKKDHIIKTEVTPNNFDWLLGNWYRVGEKEGTETFEIWKKKNDIEYNGIGYSIQNKDTVSKEVIKIIKTGNQWDLVVRTKEDVKPIIFQVTKIEKEAFTCKNEANEFPKKIKYWKDQKKIMASVSNDDMEILFEFKKIDQ